MLFWLIAAALTFAAVGLVLLPLSRAPAYPADGASGDERVYRDQLRSLEKDVARGTLEEATALEARAEIGRRILQAREKGRAEAGGAFPRGALFASVMAVPLLAWGFYTYTGQPGLPSQPLQARLNADPQNGSIAELVARAERALMDNPSDARGWRALAPIYMRLGRFDDAANAYRAIIRLNGEDAATLAALAEALSGAAGGVVTADALTFLEAAVERDPNEPRARYFMALAKKQQGDEVEAIAMWNALAENQPAGSPWAAAARQAIEIARAEQAGGVSPAPGPDAAAVDAAENMDAADRAAMIEGMVSGLDARLRREGGSVEEWSRLIRAYEVLGDRDASEEAVRRALDAFENDAGARETIRAVAGGREASPPADEGGAGETQRSEEPS